MTYEVFIVADAEEDLYEIYNYVATYDSVTKAENLLTKLEATCQSLPSLANRGHLPPELERIGVFDYQKIHYKPYRTIYQVIESTVFVHCVLDGRRDLQQLLDRRILR